MLRFILLLLVTGLSLSAQIRDVGSNPAAFSVAIDSDNYTSPSGCTSAATVVAHEINVLNPDNSIAAFAYVDLTSGFIHSSDTAIVEANVDGSFDINDASFTDYRTRVAQSCKMGCCHKTVKWTDWAYGTGGPDSCEVLLNSECSIDYDETYNIEEDGAGGFDIGSVPEGNFQNAGACYEYIYRGLYCVEDAKWIFVADGAAFGSPLPIATNILVCPIEAGKTYQDIHVAKPIGFVEYWDLRGEFEITATICSADLEFNIFKNGNSFALDNLTFIDTNGNLYNELAPFIVSPGVYTFINQDISSETGSIGDFIDFEITVDGNCNMTLTNFNANNNIELEVFFPEGQAVFSPAEVFFTSNNQIIQGELPDCGNPTPTIETIDDTIPLSEPGVITTVDVTPNDSSSDCEPISYAVSNEVNCTVVNNGDGTFDVTPIATGAWSFDYTATCDDATTSGTANVNGNATDNTEFSPCTPFVPVLRPDFLDCGAATSAYSNYFRGDFYAYDDMGDCSISDTILCNNNYYFQILGVVSNNNYPLTIDWGDGNTSTIASTATYHDYASAGTYNITVTSDCDGTIVGSTSITVICNTPGSACTTAISITRPLFFSCTSALNTYTNSFDPQVYVFGETGNCGASRVNEIFTNQDYQFYFGFAGPTSGFTVTIDWGDGNTEPYSGPITHTYLTSGNYTITLTNDCDGNQIGTMTITVI